MKRSNEEKAVLYAAYKTLEKELEKDGELDSPTYLDVSGKSLIITFANGTVVSREAGTNGDGSIQKKAVQNLYGYPMMALLVHRLMKFHQWDKLRVIILEVLCDVIRRKGTNVREEIRTEYPDVAILMDELQQNLPIPPRKESTPRNFDLKRPATITIRNK